MQIGLEGVTGDEFFKCIRNRPGQKLGKIKYYALINV